VHTLDDRLKSVEKAIAAIESGGQDAEIEVNGDRRRITRAAIKELYQERRRLVMAINRQDGGGVRYGIPG